MTKIEQNWTKLYIRVWNWQKSNELTIFNNYVLKRPQIKSLQVSDSCAIVKSKIRFLTRKMTLTAKNSGGKIVPLRAKFLVDNRYWNKPVCLLCFYDDWFLIISCHLEKWWEWEKYIIISIHFHIYSMANHNGFCTD